MNWYYLTLAILFDVAGTASLKLANGFSRPTPTILMVLFYVLCFGFLALALKKMEMSVAYTVWAGVGTALMAITGVIFFKEQLDLTKIISIILILIGIVGLNLHVLKT